MTGFAGLAASPQMDLAFSRRLNVEGNVSAVAIPRGRGGCAFLDSRRRRGGRLGGGGEAGRGGATAAAAGDPA